MSLIPTKADVLEEVELCVRLLPNEVVEAPSSSAEHLRFGMVEEAIMEECQIEDEGGTSSSSLDSGASAG
jgi:hypothetical protein